MDGAPHCLARRDSLGYPASGIGPAERADRGRAGMLNDTPRLGIGVFGYRKASVNQVISDHVLRLRQAEGQALAAEARASELEQELSSTREDLEHREQAISELAEKIRFLESARPSAEVVAFMNEELAQILTAAQEASAQIVERAKSTVQIELDQAGKVLRDVGAERERFVAWRQEAEPFIRAVQVRMDAVRRAIDRVPARVADALKEIQQAITAMDGDLVGALNVPEPPSMSASAPVAELGAGTAEIPAEPPPPGGTAVLEIAEGSQGEAGSIRVLESEGTPGALDGGSVAPSDPEDGAGVEVEDPIEQDPRSTGAARGRKGDARRLAG